MSDFLYLLTPKRATERLLSETLVSGTYTNQKSDALVFALLRAYAPNVPIVLHNPASWPNPVVNVTFPFVALGTALRDLCGLSGVAVEVADDGALILRSFTIDEQLKHARFQAEELHRIQAIQH